MGIAHFTTEWEVIGIIEGLLVWCRGSGFGDHFMTEWLVMGITRGRVSGFELRGSLHDTVAGGNDGVDGG